MDLTRSYGAGAKFIVFGYVGLALLFPKISVFGAPLYPFELLFILYGIFEMMRSLPRIGDAEYIFYAVVIFWQLVYSFIGAFTNDFFSTQPLLITVKFAVILFLPPILKKYPMMFSDRDVMRVVYAYAALILAAALYVLMNLARHPLSGAKLLYTYSNQVRDVGFTGQVLTAHGLSLLGTTSVQMGGLVAFVFTLCLVRYVQNPRFSTFVWLFPLIVALALTQSRTGLAIFFFVLIVFLFRKDKPLRWMKVFLVVSLTLLLLFDFQQVVGFLTNFTSVGRLVSHSTDAISYDQSLSKRFVMIGAAFSYLSKHPVLLLTGTGYGGPYSQALIGYKQVESYFVTLWFQMGIVPVLLVSAQLVTMWIMAIRRRRSATTYAARLCFLSISIYLPGLFAALCISGNLLQTDFIAPFFYFLYFWAVYHERSVAAVLPSSE